MLEDLKRRGVEDVLFFCVDGLKGFKEVIADVYPQSIVQRCMVHMVRSSTRFVKDKDIKAVGADLRKIYTSATMRKVTKAKGAWTDEKALTKQLFLALTTNEKSWKRQAFNWKTVQKELMEQFGERFSKWIDS